MAVAAQAVAGLRPTGRQDAGVPGRVDRPVLRAWVAEHELAEHERERKRMGLRTQQDYAQWIGVDPAQWSKWRSATLPVPRKQGRRLAQLLDHNPRIASLWLRLALEQEQLALVLGDAAGGRGTAPG
jgi:hypothetical protein